jgi:hypothetical protein
MLSKHAVLKVQKRNAEGESHLPSSTSLPPTDLSAIKTKFTGLL